MFLRIVISQLVPRAVISNIHNITPKRSIANIPGQFDEGLIFLKADKHAEQECLIRSMMKYQIYHRITKRASIGCVPYTLGRALVKHFSIFWQRDIGMLGSSTCLYLTLSPSLSRNAAYCYHYHQVLELCCLHWSNEVKGCIATRCLANFRWLFI